MAILGAQVVFSMVIFSVLQKLSPFYSFGRWLLCGKLVRYLHPTDEELRTLAGIPSTSTKGKGKKNDVKKKNEPFTIPCSAPVQLDTARVEAIDLVPLRFYSDYQWLVDFALGAATVYFLTEVYFAFFTLKSELNISILWCLLAIGFCLRILVLQTAMYFRAEEGGERVLCVTFGFFFLVAAMGILVVDVNTLEFGLEEGYTNFSQNAEKFLKLQGIESQGPVSFLTFKIILAIICSLAGAFLTFPGLRYSKCHLDALKYSRENPLKQTLLHLNFILPLVVLLLWVRPIGRDMLCGKNWRMSTTVMPEASFEIFRLVLVGIMFILRLCLLPVHMQAHLNLAYEKIETVKKESGRISNVELQKTVARVFYYLCIVALQYLIPVIMLLFMMFLQKTLGDYYWSALFGESFASNWELPPKQLFSPPANITGDSIAETAAKFTLAMANLRQIFSPLWYRGLMSFLTWWVCGSWFTCTAFGMYYYSRVATA